MEPVGYAWHVAAISGSDVKFLAHFDSSIA